MKTFVPALALVSALVLLSPSSAFAKNEFENAFKHELGRIAAHEAVGGGKHLLGAILFGHGGHHASRGHRGYDDRGYGHGGRHYDSDYGHRSYKRHHYRGHHNRGRHYRGHHNRGHRYRGHRYQRSHGSRHGGGHGRRHGRRR